jgi:hydroxymethylpyrimidine pyrophosphatase-like HAD family hydrolase
MQVSVAMGNAGPALRQLADVITATNDEDGVAQVIEKLVLQAARVSSSSV